jgi:5-histidylcysteine sulfoxide synthase/putative 4-mercaptohistidine N1-methyltranferase
MNSLGIKVLKTPLLIGSSASQKREELKNYFNQTFELYEDLFACINSHEAYYLRPEPLRHPLIFYFGHTVTFFINKLIIGKYIDSRINARFESIFAIGVDEMSWDDLDTNHYDWPTVDEVADYRRQVNVLVNHVIDTMPLELPITQDSIAWIILMGIEHERIHLETSSVIIRMLPLNYLNKSINWTSCTETGKAKVNQLVPVAGQYLNLGRGNDNTTYGWDNEYGLKEVYVNDFLASKYLVSNQEFISFIEAGGYQNFIWWTKEGQKWLEYTKVLMPRFWRYHDGQFWQRNLLEEIPLPLNWPVEVNYLEAKAFCNWKSQIENAYIHLPTEAEWTLLRNKIDTDLPYWDKAPGNINLEYYASSCAVDQFETDGFYDVIGNVWQWTESPIDVFPGFKVHKLYDDFSTPTFDGQHNLIKGGSWISTGNLAILKSRYAFRRHFFQHAGFRYIKTESPAVPIDKMNIYESDKLVSQYLEFHYGDEYFNVPNYPVACVNSSLKFINQQAQSRALDLGCSVGRSTFELAKYFDHVDGIDFSARFIQQGIKFQEEGLVRFIVTTEGDLVDYKELKLSDLGYDQLIKKIAFIQGDACNLKPIFKNYNLIFCGNLIDRLYNPALFLQTIADRLTLGGILILTSPYTWLEEFTEKKKWLGGIKIFGENRTTLEGIKGILIPQFNLLEVFDIPFVFRETQRKFQHSMAQMTVWQLKNRVDKNLILDKKASSHI